jgi:hypothetical protein
MHIPTDLCVPTGISGEYFTTFVTDVGHLVTFIYKAEKPRHIWSLQSIYSARSRSIAARMRPMSFTHIACCSEPLSSWYSIPGWMNCMTPALSRMNVTEVKSRSGPDNHQSLSVPWRQSQSIAIGNLNSLTSTARCTRCTSSGSFLPALGWNTPTIVKPLSLYSS